MPPLSTINIDFVASDSVLLPQETLFFLSFLVCVLDPRPSRLDDQHGDGEYKEVGTCKMLASYLCET